MLQVKDNYKMNKVIEERTKRTEWYRDARFGMFIHWGLYAIPARGEWVRSMEQIPHETTAISQKSSQLRITTQESGRVLRKRRA